MARKIHARRYAQAVFEIAREKNRFDRWQTDLARITEVAGDAALAAWLDNPKVRLDAKAGLLSEKLSGASPFALNLVYLLMRKGRLAMAGDIAEEYQHILDSFQGIERALVTAAIPLDDDQKQRIVQRLEAILGKKVVVSVKVDPGVVGGIAVRVDGKLLDGSTFGRLMALKTELARTRE